MADVSIFRSALEQLHPQLYRYTRKEGLDRSSESLTEDARNGMSQAEFLTRVSEIAVKVHCGHTFVNLMNQKDADLERLFNKQTFIPLYFKLIGTRMLVTENVSQDPRLNSGTEILEINGVPINRILQTCLKFSNADGLHNNAHRLRSLEVQREPGEARNYTNLFDVYYPQLFHLRSASYQLKTLDRKTRKLSVVTTSALMKAERIAKAEAKFGSLPSPESAWQFRNLGDQTAYMKLASFFTYQWKVDTAESYCRSER